jgi:hypothetical protein
MNGTQHPSNDQVLLIVVSMSRYGLPSCDHASMIVLPSWQLFLLFLGQGSGNISINEVGWRKIGRLRRVKRGLDRRLNVGLWVVDLLVEEVLEFGQVVEGAPRIIEVHETWRNLKWYLRDVKNVVVVKLLNRMWSLLNGSIKINRLKHPSNHLKETPINWILLNLPWKHNEITWQPQKNLALSEWTWKHSESVFKKKNFFKLTHNLFKILKKKKRLNRPWKSNETYKGSIYRM